MIVSIVECKAEVACGMWRVACACACGGAAFTSMLTSRTPMPTASIDPVTAIGLVASADQLTQYCVSAAAGINSIYQRQGRACESLLAIKRECTTLGTAV